MARRPVEPDARFLFAIADEYIDRDDPDKYRVTVAAAHLALGNRLINREDGTVGSLADVDRFLERSGNRARIIAAPLSQYVGAPLSFSWLPPHMRAEAGQPDSWPLIATSEEEKQFIGADNQLYLTRTGLPSVQVPDLAQLAFLDVVPPQFNWWNTATLVADPIDARSA